MDDRVDFLDARIEALEREVSKLRGFVDVVREEYYSVYFDVTINRGCDV